MMTNNKSVLRYLDYSKERVDDDTYRLYVVCFQDDGNTLKNMKHRNIKTIMCSAAKLSKQETTIKNNIENTKKRISAELRRIGANPLNESEITK